MANLVLKNINKVYPNGVHAVCNFDVEINDKEFVVLVGPSGCGKTTVLRMISGLENISRGEFWIDDNVVNLISPADRDISMVFQSYALYPHMTVYENIGFSLKLRKIDKFTISDKVNKAASRLGLGNLLSRKPKELSGGQKQRVALARSIVRKPKIFLMDEPLSNLDAALRQEMRILIKNLHKDLGTNIFYVTHDQVEAMTMADRIIVMNDGFIQQVGTPDEVFLQPANIFVASFIGTPKINLIEGTIRNGSFIGGGFNFKLLNQQKEKLKNFENKKLVLGVRPTDIQYNEAVKLTHVDSMFGFVIENKEILGSEVNLFGYNEKDESKKVITIRMPYYEYSILKENDEIVEFAIDLNKIHLFDLETSLNLTTVNNHETQKAINNFIENKGIRETRNSLMSLQKFRDASKIKLSQIYSNFTKLENAEHDKAKLEFKISKLNMQNKDITKIQEKINGMEYKIKFMQDKQEHLQRIKFAESDILKYYDERINYNNFLIMHKEGNEDFKNKKIHSNQKWESKKKFIFNDAVIPKFTLKNLISIKYYKKKKEGFYQMIGFNPIEAKAKQKTILKELISEAKKEMNLSLANSEQNNLKVKEATSNFKTKQEEFKNNYKNELQNIKEKFSKSKQEFFTKIKELEF